MPVLDAPEDEIGEMKEENSRDLEGSDMVSPTKRPLGERHEIQGQSSAPKMYLPSETGGMTQTINCVLTTDQGFNDRG